MSGELLKDSSIVHEKKLIQNFLTEIAKNGLVTYGENEVLEALEIGKIRVLLLSEGIDKTIHRFKCPNCETEKVLNENQVRSEIKCTNCQHVMESMEEAEYIDYLREKAESIGAETEVISTETDEGKQFMAGFGGLAAFLRYK